MKITVFALALVLLSSPYTLLAKHKKKRKQEHANSISKEHLNGNVKIVKETVYNLLDSNKLINNQTKFFNEKGYLTNVKYYGRDGNMVKELTMIYDKNNFLTGVLDSPIVGAVMFTLFKNDAKGNDTASITLKKAAKAELVTRVFRQYDAAGNMTDEEDFDNKSQNTGHTHYIYDKNNNVEQLKEYGTDGALKGEYRYQYDENGNKTRTEYLDGSGKRKYLYTFKYFEQDNKENWLKFERYDGDKAQFRMEKTISYY